MTQQSGIYIIRNTISGKVYVGSARHIEQRWKAHRRSLDANQHHSYKLQRAWNKYGESAFEWRTVELICEAELIAREQHWIDETKAAAKGYNVCPVAGSTLGVKQTDATREKLRGRKASEETRRRMSEAQKGRKHTAETRAKIGAIHRGKSVSEQTRQKLSEAQRNLSPEARERYSIAAKNRSAEHQAKLTAAATGRRHTAEAKAKVSAAVRGRIVSAETRQRMSLAAKAAIQRRKERAGASL